MRILSTLRKIVPALFAGVLILGAGQGSAQDVTKIDGLQAAIINKHAVCRLVRNKGISPVMVPHKSALEWATGLRSFLAAPRTNMEIGFCPNPATGDPMPDPNAPRFIGNGTIAVNDVNNPVFSHFKSCFGFGTGAFFLKNTPCVLDGNFWDVVRQNMCKNTGSSISIGFSGFTMTASGNACAVSNAFNFYERARNSSCRPNLCVSDVAGSCTFECK